MPETKHSQENLAYIRTHVDNLERMVRFQISADPQSRERIRAAFGARQHMAELYLALADGPRTQEELVTHLQLSQPTVSRIVKDMYEAGMVRKTAGRGEARLAYTWTDLEEMLGVSRMAREFIANSKGALGASANKAKSSQRPGKKKKP